MERSDRERLHGWMVRLADGDRAAFHPVYEALWPVLRRFAERAMGGGADAEDAAQAALTKVFFRASDLDPDRDGLSWALGIAAYECKTLRQRARRRREQPEGAAPEEAAEEETPEERVIARDLEAAVLDAVGALRPADAEALRRVLAGERPDGSGATFRKRVQRALDRLRAEWRARHGTE